MAKPELICTVLCCAIRFLSAAETEPSYADWLKGNSNRGRGGEKLIVTVFESEGRRSFEHCYIYGTRIDNDWGVHHFLETAFGGKGSSGWKVSETARPRVEEILHKLPDDHSRLAPEGRRILVQSNSNQSGVYDRANLPDDILELFRLAHAGFMPHMPEIKPTVAAEKNGRFEHYGVLAALPSGTQFVTSSGHNYKLWDATTRSVVKPLEYLKFDINEMTFNRSGTHAILNLGQLFIVDCKEWSFKHHLLDPGPDNTTCFRRAEFSADGRYIVAQWCEPASIRTYEIDSWRRVSVPGFPQTAAAYFGAPSGKRAVILTKDHNLAFWNQETSQEYGGAADVKLSPQYLSVVYSPDESLVAIASHTDVERDYRDVRIRVWSVESGKFVKELWPFEQAGYESVEGMVWSSDGKYLIGAPKSGGLFSHEGFSVWNVNTGRQRGTLLGAGRIHGLATVQNGKTLVASTTEGNVAFWDLEEAIKTVKVFETSLEAP